MAGRVVHFEVPYDDVDRAADFYREVFGWHVQPVPEFQYHVVTTGPVTDEGMPAEVGFVNGGMFARQPHVAQPVITIDVDDIDATLAEIEARGGSVVEPRMQVGQMGFAAYFTDCEGNLLGLWQSADG